MTALAPDHFNTLQSHDAVYRDAPVASTSQLSSFLLSPFGPISNLKKRGEAWLASFNLPSPGSYEAFGREAKAVLPTNYIFDGAKAELTKHFSVGPAFLVSHNFALGSQMGPSVNPGNYSFGAVYGSDSKLCQGTIDGDGSLNGRCNLSWDEEKHVVTRLQAALSPTPMVPSMFIFEQDYTAHNVSINFKTYNPSLADGTGTFMLGALASVTPKLALGIEAVNSRSLTAPQNLGVGFLARYKDTLPTDKGRDYIATAQYTPNGILNLSYWQKLGDKVDAGAEYTIMPDQSGKLKPLATVGAKYDYRLAAFRGCVDSQGKISAFLEQRLNPFMVFLVSGEIDHYRNTSKFGVGITIETQAGDETVMANSTPSRPPV